jgi:tetratricopeptide (TPR) repeat protein
MSIRHSNYLTLLAMISLIGLIAVACTDAEPDSGMESDEPTVVVTSDGPVVDDSPDSTTEPEIPIDPTATSGPSSTPTTTPDPEETPESDTESVYFYLNGFNSINRGEYIDAERTFTTVIEIEPGFARGWDGRGQALLYQGKYEEAMLDFDRAIELKPNLEVAYSNRALTRVALNDMEGAARDARRAFELDEESVAAHLVLGRVHARYGDSAKALEWFDLAVITDPEDASTWWWRGRFYRDVLGAGNAALNDFNTAIEISPAQAALYLDRAQLYIQANVEEELVRADLDEAISLSQDPKLPTMIERAEELIKSLDERPKPAE